MSVNNSWYVRGLDKNGCDISAFWVRKHRIVKTMVDHEWVHLRAGLFTKLTIKLEGNCSNHDKDLEDAGL